MESSIQLVSNTITELLRKHATELSEIPSFEFCNTPQFETDFISFLQEQSRKSLTKVESVQNSDQFYSSIKSPLLTVVEFTTQWCGVCKRFAPLLAKYSLEFPSVTFLTLDVEQHKDAIKEASLITETPTFWFYRGNELLHTTSMKEVDAPKLKQLIAQHSSPPLPKAKIIPLTETLNFSAQPSLEQLKNLQIIGIKSVINLRDPQDTGFVSNEKDLLTAQKIEYCNVPVKNAASITEETIATVTSKLKELPSPCLVHCTSGFCACIVVLLKEAKEIGAGVSDVLTWATDLGFNLSNNPSVYSFISTYLKQPAP